MKEIISTITSKGQITLPAEVRRLLGVAVHDKFAFRIDDDANITVHRAQYPTIESLRGAAGSLSNPMTWQEIVRSRGKTIYAISLVRPNERRVHRYRCRHPLPNRR